MKLFNLLSFLTVAATLFGQDKQIAITFDDLPCSQCADAPTALEVNEKILSALAYFNAPAIGFVNEGKMWSNGQLDSTAFLSLQKWKAAGLPLGNHTYAHSDLNEVTISAYLEDVRKGERSLEQFWSQDDIRYFRHPFLNTGKTRAIQSEMDDSLEALGYTIAPVTIDNDEYIYAYCYHKAKMQKDSVNMRFIGADYLRYMRSVVNHFDHVARDQYNRPIKQTLLIHANELNADYLFDLMKMLRNDNWGFLSLTEALTDSVYQQEAKPTAYGYSWLLRWMDDETRKSNYPPEISDGMSRRWNHYRNSSEKFEMQNMVGPSEEIDNIYRAIRSFSKSYVENRTEDLVAHYTEDAKIFPDRNDVIEGRADIQKRWTLRDEIDITRHVVDPIEIVVEGDIAYDYGYYYGTTVYNSQYITNWSGKYVIVWKKVNGSWKIYLDMWNQL